jgi:hypothetical protein
MRILLPLILCLATHAALAQATKPQKPLQAKPQPKQDTARMEQHKDSMVTAIRGAVGISHATADSVYNLITGYTLKIRAVVHSHSSKDQKDQQTHALAAERDDKIQRLLTAGQITQLKALYARSKPATPAH